MTVEFLITTLVVILLPGTGVIYTIAVGLGRGFVASASAAFGCTLGIVPAALASVVGLSAIFHTSALAFLVLKYLGAAYLLYMAWSFFKQGGALDIDADPTPVSLLKTAVTGTLINILNPKLSLFFLAFLPQFVDPNQANATMSMLGLAAVFMLLTLIVFVLYGAFAAFVRDFVLSRPAIMRVMKYSFAGAFGFLGLKLALAER